MKISRNWLQDYFDAPLPGAQAIADALTFHAFEIESVEGDILDVKVTPNRGHDCLSHRGIAKELSAILKLSMKKDPLRESVSLGPRCGDISVRIEDPRLCPRFSAEYIAGVKVGPAPAWMRERLESVGQRSINNIVDATNYVMFDIGQPLHAFDAGKLSRKSGKYSLLVRRGKKGERMRGLDNKTYSLTDEMGVIVDAGTGEVASIAGIKGGMQTGVDERTTSIVLEAANWDHVAIRRTSQVLKLRTDASQRFEQDMSAEYPPYGISSAAALIAKFAGGTAVGFADEYPEKQRGTRVDVSQEKINAILGTGLSISDIADVFKRLDLPCVEKRGTFTVGVPFERLDLEIGEDLAEEVGRIIGYDKVPSTPLPPPGKNPEIDADFYAAERAREELAEKGYSEVFTSVFADRGERVVANKADGVRPYLRGSLIPGLTEAVERNVLNRMENVRLFEIGTIWKGGKEMIVVGAADAKSAKEEPLEPASADSYGQLPLTGTERYQPFSRFPFIRRDIAMWSPENSEMTTEQIGDLIWKAAGDLCMQVVFFDRFEKGGRSSFAYKLVFQSPERTLTDNEVDERMKIVMQAMEARGFAIR
ncbi:MAG: hypothetical protein RLZZ416_720 [Candidatus Parcubacteria bacterium]|jgi:phenylalanyl-tRNA synthetase beta chain